MERSVKPGACPACGGNNHTGYHVDGTGIFEKCPCGFAAYMPMWNAIRARVLREAAEIAGEYEREVAYRETYQQPSAPEAIRATGKRLLIAAERAERGEQ